jgi:pyruvate/2-oxoglutarate dehydrogenase complex dihydrolipoamide acyltransferase (E2) component
MPPLDPRIPIIVPDFARAADKPITIGHWYRKVGQLVHEGARVVDLMCDKAEFELPAPATGVLVDAMIAFNGEVAVGQVIGALDTSVEPWIWDPPPEHPTAIGRCKHCVALLFPGEHRCRNCGALM